MIFLLDYDRITGRLVSVRDFPDDAKAAADSARLELELTLHRRGVQREVVLLQAPSLQALRQTHRRYFEDLSQIVRSTST